MENKKEYFRKYYLNHREQMIKNAMKSYLENRYKNKSAKREYNRLYYEQRLKYNIMKNPLKNKLQSYENKSNEEIRKNKKLETKIIISEKPIICTYNIIVEL